MQSLGQAPVITATVDSILTTDFNEKGVSQRSAESVGFFIHFGSLTDCFGINPTLKYTAKSSQPFAMFLKTGSSNVVLPTLFKLVSHINNVVTPDSASIILLNVVDNIK